MTETVYTRTYAAPTLDKREVMRYAGVRSEVAELEAALEECIVESAGVFSYKVCYRVLDIKVSGDEITLGNVRLSSRALAKALDGCGAAVVFAATVGIGIDRLIARYALKSPSRAVLLQAIGTERIEALCDEFCGEIAGAHPRFSPGYGDLPLEAQRDIFALLDCPRRIGVSLNESLLMTPSKSVTAIVGVKDKNELDIGE